MTFQELMNNPTGKGTGFVFSREQIKENLTNRFNALAAKGKEFKYFVYNIDNKMVYHIKIPSEKHSNFWFDVVIEFQEELTGTKKSLLNNDVKIFTNSPGFIFNGYAYVAKRQDLLIPWLENKLNRKSYENPPDIKNPVYSLGFDKAIFFACMFIKEKALYNMENIEGEIKKYSKNEMKKAIENFDDIFKNYNAKKELKSQKKKVTVIKKKLINGKPIEVKKITVNKINSKIRSMQSNRKVSSVKNINKRVKKV